MNAPQGTNDPTTIGSRDYSGNAVDQMQGHGVPPSAVEDALNKGNRSAGNTPGTTVNTSSDGRVIIITSSDGKVVTVIKK